MPNNRDFHSTEVSRNEARDKSVELKILTKVLKGSDNNIKKDNGNVDGETAMGTALHTFSNLAKQFFLKEDEFIPTDTAEQIDKGGIYAHDLEFFNLTTTCCQIDMFSLLRNGFHNGEGWVRGCKRFASACTNLCVIVQGNQNEQHGGQSSSALDYELGRFVDVEFLYQILILYKTRPKHRRPQDRIDFISKLRDDLVKNDDRNFFYFRQAVDLAEEYDCKYPEPIATIKSWFNPDEWYQIIRRVEDQVYQGMEAVVFNLSSMHSRAGAQVPFSSVNFGTCTSWEGRLVAKALLQAQWKGLGQDESPMFPIVIFKIKDGINYEHGTRNHDLLLRAIQVSSKRLFPNFSFEDSSFNKTFWRDNDPQHEVAYMGCRTRVVTNVHDNEYEQTMSRGNVSFTTVNLPFAALECKRDYPDFKLNRDNLDQFFSEYIVPKMETLRDLLIRRLRVVGARACRGQPFLMGQSIWVDSGYYSTVAYLNQIYPRLAKLEAGREDRIINLTKSEINALKKRYNTVLKRLNQGEALCDENGVGFASEDEKYSVGSPIYKYLGLDNRLKRFLQNGKQCPNISEISNPILENWLFDLPNEMHRRILKKIKRPHTLKDPQIQRLKHGSLTIGYIGLAECLTALYGEHHGESDTANLLGRLLVQKMRNLCDKWAQDYSLNFSLLQTPAEGLSFNALVKVRKEFGEVTGVSDKNYLTNSSHVPVSYRISAFDKIRIECSPLYDEKTDTTIPGYSALANAGHICYVELEHEPGLNPEAFLQVLQFMHDNDVGYGAVNHPVDRDPACGYIGVI